MHTESLPKPVRAAARHRLVWSTGSAPTRLLTSELPLLSAAVHAELDLLPYSIAGEERAACCQEACGAHDVGQQSILPISVQLRQQLREAAAGHIREVHRADVLRCAVVCGGRSPACGAGAPGAMRSTQDSFATRRACPWCVHARPHQPWAGRCRGNDLNGCRCSVLGSIPECCRAACFERLKSGARSRLPVGSLGTSPTGSKAPAGPKFWQHQVRSALKAAAQPTDATQHPPHVAWPLLLALGLAGVVRARGCLGCVLRAFHQRESG